MQLSLNWIKEYVNLPDVSAKDLALAVTMSTVEVEEIIDQAESLNGIVVGKVLEVVNHPKADRLSICRVDCKSEILQIICGGSNLSKGMLVAVAKVGSFVRWHGQGAMIKLENAKIRGVESFGMIASSVEIGLQRLFPAADDHEIMDLSQYLIKVGEPLAKALGLNDTILVIDNKSMTHRPDLWGQYGLAREIAAIYKTRLKPLKIPALPGTAGTKPLTVEVQNKDLCWRYVAVVIDTVTVGPSPWWLRRDLESFGINSVNNIVDVTNYVMATLGQPLHAFKYAALAKNTIIVNTAGKEEQFTALNGKTYAVKPDTLMIQDPEKNVAIAGIIGGMNSGIDATTETIVLEAATFLASSVRKSSIALGLRTEASARFEKKLDPELAPVALRMAVDLIMKLSPQAKVASSMIDQQAIPSLVSSVEVSKKFLDQRLGKVLDPKEVTAILKRLEFGVRFKKNVFSISIPSFRRQGITIPEDIVEEVARIYGYGMIEPRMPLIQILPPVKTTASRVEREVRSLLSRSFGYTELYTYSFAQNQWAGILDLTRNQVMVKNALTPDQAFLRTSLLPGLLARAVDNLRWSGDFKLFELGRVFSKNPGEFAAHPTNDQYLPSQPLMLAGVRVSKEASAEELYRGVRGMIEQMASSVNIAIEFRESEHPKYGVSCYEVRTHNKTLGMFGLLKQGLGDNEFKAVQVAWWDLQFDILVKFADFSRTYTPASKFPSITRDVAIVVAADLRWGDLEKTLRNTSPLVKSLELFDVFTSAKLGENKKSLAFRLTFGSDDRTLEATEVDKVIMHMTAKLKDSFNAVVR